MLFQVGEQIARPAVGQPQAASANSEADAEARRLRGVVELQALQEMDKAVASFSLAYADQTEKDHAALERAIRAGKVEALVEKGR